MRFGISSKKLILLNEFTRASAEGNNNDEIYRRDNSDCSKAQPPLP
jgi:hypothetical protein